MFPRLTSFSVYIAQVNLSYAFFFLLLWTHATAIYRYNCKLLLAVIDENHRGTYDFIYLPIDFKVNYLFHLRL
jgi:hypothetical protein